MNKSPLNYLLTTALGVILWVITAIFFGGVFSESLTLASSTPEDFLASYRLFLGLAAFAGILNCLYWYYYGSLDTTAGRLDKAKRVWLSSIILQIICAVALLFILVIINLSEGMATKDWAIIFCMLSLHTWFFFWFCTFFMSPRTVKYIPFFK
ncbi:hypothetical protein [uncultured Chitinophaga sp.]|jgi:hypothetical protein|uniref:hypothetical protein n=1 Tax=uncultured Chitinophaga sp. TaxID=339340 RepID=UPI00260BE9F9|nr:hypothetical protein [uncultured Chitinophaga sp.]